MKILKMGTLPALIISKKPKGRQKHPTLPDKGYANPWHPLLFKPGLTEI